MNLNYNVLGSSRDTWLKNFKNCIGIGNRSNSVFLGLLLIFTFLFGGGNIYAQVGGYTLTESTETYAQITGTTSTAVGDDGTQLSIPIGFTFNFGGVSYTTFSVSTNGLIKLGTGSFASFGGFSNAINNTNTNRPLIAPFWDDNNLDAGTIRYSSSGGVLSINYHNTKIGGGGGVAGAACSYIVRLYQTTNVIEIVYGSPFTTSQTVTASVGLNDLTSFLSVTPAAVSTASNATANNSIDATVMANLAGKKLIFTPPAPPSCGVPTGLAVTDVTSTTADIAWVAPGVGTPATYDWEIRTSGAGGSGAGGLTTLGSTTAPTVSVNDVPGLTAKTAYNLYVRTNCSGGGGSSAWAGPIAFVTALDCSAAIVLTAGTPVTSGNLAVAGGAYSVTSCGFTTPGNERLYSFTTTVAGVYSLDVTGVNGGSGYIDYFFKDASGGCGPTGWTCIDDINAVGSATITLAASTTYFILLDAESASGTANHTFQVTAPAGPVTCGGTFYDNGGAGGNYSNNLNTTTTIFPVNVGDGVIATFTAFGTESCCDSLSIYDGPDATYPLIGTYAGTTSPGVVTSTDSASGALTFVFTSDTSLVDIGWAANITCFTFPTDTPDYVNLQFPATATILAGGSATVYAQVYEAGLTDSEPGLSGQAAGIEAWIGISPIGSNSNPNTWTTWIPATHNAGHISNNDEYQASIGSALVPGTYYYASRFRLNGGPFVYGGNPFNAWDGTTSVSGVLTVNPNPTQCATNVAPVDAATNVTIGTVALSWAAPTSGPAPTSYDVYYGTTSGALTLATNTNSLSYNASAPAYSTPYYWRIVPKSAVGGDATGCSEWSFTTQADPIAPYCSTVAYSIDVEPITSVDFAGITNTSSNTVDGSPSLENFISISGNVTTENSYTMTLKGNTAGNFTTNFRVFIDWNQDGDFADLGETFNAGSVTNSNGLDAISAVSTIAVPSSALAGSTRMRIKKLYSADSGSVDNPCAGGQYGQTEDYTLNVTLCTPLNWYVDNDGDTYGDPTTLVSACNSPGANYVLVSGDCNDANAAVNPNATEVCYDGIDNNCDGTIDEGCTPIISVVQTAQCGSTLSSINQQIFANLVAGAQGYRFRVTDMSTMQVQTIDRNLRVFQLTQLTNYAFDRTYQVEVSIRYNNVWQPFYGAPCTVTTPATTTQVQTAQCGGTLTTIGDAIYANNVPFATGYKFRITNLLTSAQEEVERPLRDIKMTQTSIAEFNSTYSVEVAVRNTNGLYLPYGTPCNITTPSFPTTQLQLAQCDVILTNPNTIIYADSYVGATTYRFRFTNTGLGYTYQFDKPLRSFALNTVPGLLPGETYSVQVSIEIGGVFGPYGKVCTLTTPGSARATETTKPALAFNAIVSPNPFGESFGLQVTVSTEETIQVKVYDMLGKLVESREVDSTTISELQIGATYPSGVYNVIVSQGEQVKTLRVIKR